MSTSTTSPIVAKIRRLAENGHARQQSDQDLLAEFIGQRDETAFHALVRRHGPMVWDVGRGVLGNEADADDAFQATFLVLARKAGSVRKSASLASWLHGVAYRTALKARARFARQRSHETRVPARATAGADDVSWGEVQRVLHEELSGLSERHRAPLVLCYLQGKTQDEAATVLCVAKSTLKMRLERGRALLRTRLVRRGFGPAAALVACAWPGAAASAAVPAAIVGATVKAAVLTAQHGTVLASPAVIALTEGMSRVMLLAKVKTAAMVGVIAVLALGGGAIVGARALVAQAQDVNTPTDKTEQLPAAQPRPRALRTEDSVSKVVGRLAGQLQKQPMQRLPGPDQLGLYLMDLDSRRVTLIAAEVDQERAYCGTPCWSQDGSRILFDASPGMNFGKTRLQTLELTNQGLGLSSFGAGNCPTLSPDGRRIAYLLNPGAVENAQAGIWFMNADGTQRRHVGSYGKPKWSPDGRYVLICSFANPTKLSLLDLETGTERPLEVGAHQVYSVPSWVDATTLVAQVRSEKGHAVALIDVTNPAAATVKETLWKRGDGADVESLYPVYSPATKRCVFAGRDKEGQALYSFVHGNAETPRRLETGAMDGKIASLNLSPDGRYLLFCSDRAR